MERPIRRAAVLGAGVMGRAIAAHLANAGIATCLLDVVPGELTKDEIVKGQTIKSQEVRDRYARQAVEALMKSKPAALFARENLGLISIGNLEDHLGWLSGVDWVLEAVTEDLRVKKILLKKVAEHRLPGSIVSTNTSGISINKMAEDMPEEFRQHFLGTHFFNPPRYTKLLEVIPTPDTLPWVVEFMARFSEKELGKGVIVARDTPSFIANRIGVFALLVTIRHMLQGGYLLEEVEAITGPALGRPKSASFRTLDMVGLDTFAAVAANLYTNLPGPERQRFELPDFIYRMVEKGWLGDKSGQGFYKRTMSPSGQKNMLVLDCCSLEYRPLTTVRLDAVEAAKAASGEAAKIRSLVNGQDRAGNLAWQITRDILVYCAEKVSEIAADITAVDRAMRWGFNWSLGPFEIWDALGIEQIVPRLEEEGVRLPHLVRKMSASGISSFYRGVQGEMQYLDVESLEYQKLPRDKEVLILLSLKRQNGVIRHNDGASLVDMGEGVACLEFHGPNNSIGPDGIKMMRSSIEEVDRNYRGLLIANQGRNFCVGANLALILLKAQVGDWDEIDLMVKRFQEACMAIKYSKKPVVAVPFGLSLGGGCEIALHAARIQAAAETYMGLVELGVGLVPGGGGSKEMLIRNLEGKMGFSDLHPAVMQAFETIALAKVSTSAQEARRLGYLRSTDGVTMNLDYLLNEAKQQLIHLVSQGYKPPLLQPVKVTGETGLALMRLATFNMRQGGHISHYDEYLANKLAYVLAGGRVPSGAMATEQYLLDLEREVFLSLCGEQRTQERMLHMLKTGKPLKN